VTRRLLNLLTAVSAVLCAAVCVVWVRCYSQSDWVTHRTLARREIQDHVDDQYRFIIDAEDFVGWTGDGNVRLSWRKDGWYDASDQWRETRKPEGWWWVADKVEDPAPVSESRTLWNRLGFDFSHSVPNGVFQVTDTTVCFPLWPIGVMLAALPALRVRRLLMRVRPRGHCARCGYDLRATPDRCPECGTART
jgi:hypothetical protein